MAQKPINFDEKINTALYADYRVFIFGVEVTEDVVGSLDWVYADRDGDNTASFNLQNAYDKYVLTKTNLGLVDNGSGGFSQGKPSFRLPLGDRMYSEEAKRLLVEKKKSYEPSGATQPAYPLGLRNLVFHKNDPVRVFIQNPINLNEWYCVFTGYIDSVQKTGSYVSGESNIQLQCYDIRALLKRMRVSKEPTYGKLEITEILVRPENFFGDMINPTTNNHPFARTSYEKTIEALILGQFDGQQRAVDSARGVGKFKRGDRYYYDIDNPATSYTQKITTSNTDLVGKEGAKTNYKSKQEFLDAWYKLLLYGELGRPMTYAEVSNVGSKTAPGEDYAPDHQKFYMLLPKPNNESKSGTALGASSLTEFYFSQGVEQKDFTTRYEIIKEFSETIDYQFWVTGNGDIVFEFPMYEFKPSDFGNDVSRVLTIDEMGIDDEIVDEDGDIKTVMTVTGSTVSDFQTINQGAQGTAPKQVIPRVVIANPGLVARFGVNAGTHTLPTVTNQNALRVLGYIYYQRLLSSANKLGINFAYRPWLFPNKPVYHKEEERIGNTTNVSNRLQLFSTASTNVTLKYLRKRNEQGQFVFIDGTQSVIGSYVRAWTTQSGLTGFNGPIFIDAQNSKLAKYRI